MACSDSSPGPRPEGTLPTLLDVGRVIKGRETGNASELDGHGAKRLWEEWSRSRIAACGLVARIRGDAVGWAGLTPFSVRSVYAGVAQVSIYVSPTVQGRGVGSALLGELVRVSEASGLWSLLARIFPENLPSLSLHRRHGFRQVGHLERLGKMTYGPHSGTWRDVVLMERRSAAIGN